MSRLEVATKKERFKKVRIKYELLLHLLEQKVTELFQKYIFSFNIAHFTVIVIADEQSFLTFPNL